MISVRPNAWKGREIHPGQIRHQRYAKSSTFMRSLLRRLSKTLHTRQLTVRVHDPCPWRADTVRKVF
jgi:hypothetical protein